jgi:tRNA-splicing ligase RtcB (3'-phosphate/5'-hydroxy nucleic acid ligase)
MATETDPYRFDIPRSRKSGMRVDGRVYADAALMTQIRKDGTLDQVCNVAMLPGLVGPSLAMPDAHQGYGFCIGGVAAMDPEDGVVSAGGVGFDINCGVRLLACDADPAEVRSHLEPLLQGLFRDIPCGTGQTGRLSLTDRQLDEVLTKGARWGVGQGYGTEADLERIEDGGELPGARAAGVSKRARERGHEQIGTLGSGNHFLEIQTVEEVMDEKTATAFGLRVGQIAVLIHSGSRGLGHQVCTDALDAMQRGMKKHGISVPDRQLACVPVRSAEGEEYLGAMAAAANFAFANRQMMTHWARDVFRRELGDVHLRVVYDVCHNIAKFEEHTVGGRSRRVLVHRKGATRAFPARHPALRGDLFQAGQPVLIPGSMGTASYVLVGTDRAMQETFGSSCHGAGRAMSRTRAKEETTADALLSLMSARGIMVKGKSRSGLTEEAPQAYKDVHRVVDVMAGAGLARPVARLVPRAVMKG